MMWVQSANQDKLKKIECFAQFQTIYQNCAEIERKGIIIDELSFEDLKVMLESEYRVPKDVNADRYTAMCRSIVKGHTIHEDRN
jgi:hypothetical protein